MRIQAKLTLQRLLVLLTILIFGGLSSALADGVVTDTRLRVIHTSPDAPATDIYVDQDAFFRNVTFGTISDYIPLAPGNKLVKLLPAGTPPNTPPIIDANLPFIDTRDYTLFVVGGLAQLELLQLEDDNSPPPVGQARVRFTHASPDAPPIDICIVGQNCFITNLGYKGSAVVNLDAGSYNIEVRQAGTPNVAVSVPNAQFRDGVVYGSIAMGLVQGQPSLQIINTSFVARQPGPGLPPENGAFLAPELQAILALILVSLAGSGWLFRRQMATR